MKAEVCNLTYGQRFTTCLTGRKGVCIDDGSSYSGGVNVVMHLLVDQKEWPDPVNYDRALCETKRLAPAVVVDLQG